jgi:O-acetylhomoserine (thiol)-lyase
MNQHDQNWQFETHAIHSGIKPDPETGATKSPIHQSTAYSSDTAKELEDIFKGQQYGFYYSRVANPTVADLESRVNILENGSGTVAVSSGMAAITTLIFALATSGDHIVVSKSLFGSTYYLIRGLIKNSGIEATFVETTDISDYQSAIQSNTRLIFIEAIGNPKLDVPDIEAISKIAAQASIPLVVDNTFVSPYLLNAKSFGANIIINATTKYLCGGNSAVGGVITDCGTFDWKCHDAIPITEMKKMGQNAFIAAVKKVRSNSGCAMAPLNAFLTLTAIETLAIRMDRHCENALKLAIYLQGHPKVVTITYPGLDDHPNAELVQRQFSKGCGGMLTFQVGSQEKAYAFIDHVKLTDNSVNLGDSRTLAIHPGETIYRNLTSQEKEEAGVYPDLIRVSVGLEHSDDIIADFEQALGQVG